MSRTAMVSLKAMVKVLCEHSTSVERKAIVTEVLREFTGLDVLDWERRTKEEEVSEETQVFDTYSNTTKVITTIKVTTHRIGLFINGGTMVFFEPNLQQLNEFEKLFNRKRVW